MGQAAGDSEDKVEIDAADLRSQIQNLRDEEVRIRYELQRLNAVLRLVDEAVTPESAKAPEPEPQPGAPNLPAAQPENQ